MWLFLEVPWVGLQCVIVVFPDQTRFQPVIRRVVHRVHLCLYSSFADPEEVARGAIPHPGKSQVLWVSIGINNKTPSSTGKFWTPAGTLKN